MQKEKKEKNKKIGTKKMLKRSLLIQKKILEQNNKILKKMRWMAIANYIRLAFFVIPLILALIYLPPLIARVLEEYRNIISNTPILPDLFDYIRK